MFLAYLRLFTESKARTRRSVSHRGVPHSRARRSTTQWLALGLLASSLVACAKQGEGERCDLLSGGDDCDDGLRCEALDDRNQGVGAVCCPTEGEPNSAICKGNSVDLDGDGGADNTSTADAEVETSNESTSGSSAALDAAADSTTSGSSDAVTTNPATTEAGVEDAATDNDADATTSTDVDSSSSVAQSTESTGSDSQSTGSGTSDAVSTTSDTALTSDSTSTSSDDPALDAGSDGGADASE